MYVPARKAGPSLALMCTSVMPPTQACLCTITPPGRINPFRYNGNSTRLGILLDLFKLRWRKPSECLWILIAYAAPVTCCKA
jgi:hypothetical protein